MKWNWGKGVFLGIVLFMLGTFVMVYIAVHQRVDLVSPNYYENELKYQQEIDKQANSIALKEPVKIDVAGSDVRIKFPIAEVGSAVTGTINLYRPSNSRYDKSFPVQIDSSGTCLLPTVLGLQGYWKIQISWQAGEHKFYVQKEIQKD